MNTTHHLCTIRRHTAGSDRQLWHSLLLLVLSACLSTASPVHSQSPAEQVEGLWITADGDGLIQIEADGDSLSGRIAGVPDGVQVPVGRLDDHNPDPALRNRPLKDLTIMGGYRYTGKRWKSGWIYDPNNGKRYKSTLELVDANTLKVRGFIGFSLLGRTQVWTRQR